MKAFSHCLLPCVLGCLLCLGCATVHQLPGIDLEKMTPFRASTDAFANADSSGAVVHFTLSMDEAVAAITEAFYELEIPLFHPMITNDQEEGWLVSGPFIAKCKRDCDCDKEGAAGHGADLASGKISIRLTRSLFLGDESIAVEISSMYFRTQSTGGEWGETRNLYFDSLGRIENSILEALDKAQE